MWKCCFAPVTVTNRDEQLYGEEVPQAKFKNGRLKPQIKKSTTFRGIRIVARKWVRRIRPRQKKVKSRKTRRDDVFFDCDLENERISDVERLIQSDMCLNIILDNKIETDVDTHNIEELNRGQLLTKENFGKIGVHLPLKTFGKRLDLIYSSSEHGSSLQTLYRRSRSWSIMHEVFDEQTPCLLVVSDSNGHIFGAVCTCLPRVRGRCFAGNGESMLFTLSPCFQIFPWSRENDFFLHCGKDYIGIGGSKSDCGKEAKVGLWLDDGLLHGRSTKCQTYNNEILASEEDFQICGVELWTFMM